MAAIVPVVASRAAGANNATAMAAASSGGDTFPAGSNTYLRVKNTNASTITVTVSPPTGGGPLGTTVSPYVLSPVVEATTGDRTYGPFPANPFADSNGNVNFVCSPYANVTVGAFVYPAG